MPFRHKVDDKLDIVVLKAFGDVSVMDIIYEIQNAISTKRGDGIKRRLIDMTDIQFTYTVEEAKKILGMLQLQAKILRPRKIAILFKDVPKNFDFDKLRSLLSGKNLEIGIFSIRSDAIEFLNAEPLTRK